MRRKSTFIPLLIVLFALGGCASTGKVTANGAEVDFINNSYKTLDAAGNTVDTTLKAMGDAYRAGQVSEDTKNKAIAAATVFRTAYNNAVDMVKAYAVTPTDQGKFNAQVAIANVGIQVTAVVALNIIQK